VVAAFGRTRAVADLRPEYFGRLRAAAAERLGPVALGNYVQRVRTVFKTISDPGTADTHTYSWSVTKDGSPFSSGSGAGFSFTPDDNGSYRVELTVTDNDGASSTVDHTIAVANVVPAVALSGLIMADQHVVGRVGGDRFLVAAPTPPAYAGRHVRRHPPDRRGRGR
jgi:hypothetical protein